MRVEDLMIGDIVAIANVTDGAARVTHIDSIEGGMVGTDRNFLTISSKYIEPIPINRDILEKNGWQWHLGAENDMPYLEYWTLDTLTIYTENGRYFLPIGFLAIDVSSVHRLQHFLRLSGLSDNIKI